MVVCKLVHVESREMIKASGVGYSARDLLPAVNTYKVSSADDGA